VSKRLDARKGNGTRDRLFEAIDNIARRLEVVEEIISREASKECECISSGWLFMIMESIEEVHDAIAELKSLIDNECTQGSTRD